MPRKYHTADRIVGEVIGLGMEVAGMVAAISIAALAQLFHVPTEKKLQDLTPKETWGDLVSDIPCPNCAVSVISMTDHCYACGAELS